MSEVGQGIKGFKALPLQFSSESTAQHQIFIKEHSARSDLVEKPLGRTLFVLNIPPYATESSIKRIFSNAGPVERVLLQTNPNIKEEESVKDCGFKVAYIIFKDFNGLSNALKLEKLQPLHTNGNPIIMGVKKWIKEYNQSIYNHKDLQDRVDKFMKKYDKEVEQEKRKESKEVTDEEGWTVVTKSGRNPGVRRKESVRNKLKNKKKKQLTNFYTFQIRESKMKHLAELRKKYEEDKKKIEVMKRARKFKPF